MYDYFQGWIDLILYAAILFSVVWLFFKILETRIGKSAEKGFNNVAHPVARWYENLSYNIRNVVGWLAILFYCLGVVALFIFIES